MLFNSYIFLFAFLPITLLVFFLIGGRGHHRVAISWLVLASLFFYAWWNPAYLGLMLFSILFNYAIGITLSQRNEGSGSMRKVMLVVGIGANLALLGYYKYANFFLDTIGDLFGNSFNLHEIILPLAISFFTFQQIAYLVDAYRGLTREYNFLHYCLFVTFFPQLIAGPIVHHKEMLPQFARESTYRFSHRNLAIGLTIFFIGLFKKVAIADTFALYATPVFSAADSGLQIGFFQAWEGALAYTFQLYFDFSGYSDMAIGLARMFGIRLPLNFNAPYQALNIVDFWRRWHITLSRFLRDYLYFPLGGNRKGKVRRYLNLLTTMLLGGLWHGAGWTFVIWGGLHGVYLIINHMWNRIWTRPIQKWWSRAIARSITLLAVIVGWVFFRAETFEGAKVMLTSMVNLPNNLHGRIGPLEEWLGLLGFGFSGGYLTEEYITKILWAMLWLAIVLYWPTTQQLMSKWRPALNYQADARGLLAARLRWAPTLTWGLVISLMAGYSILHLGSVSEFLYFQF